MTDNFILATDSYKLNHWQQYPEDTDVVYSYFEARPGAQYDSTVFFGLQAILQDYLVGSVVTMADVQQAQKIATAHFGDPALFNYRGWEYIVNEHDGRLPIKIKAVAEGSVVPVGNVMMTVENTDPKCFWLTNALESLLTHVWYPSTVATQSRYVKELCASYLDDTADSRDGLDFMLHDFGYRGASSHETAAIGGLAHLVNFMGTDTLPALLLGAEHYGADYNSLGFSVVATEHSVMTADGPAGESVIVGKLLENYPTGILSVVADSYDYYNFVTEIVGKEYRGQILARDGRFVVRPDSTTDRHDTPALLVGWTLERLWESFGGTVNAKGYKVLDTHVRVLWGDGIGPAGIKDILEKAKFYGFSAENLVFGMGGGLLQKVNRDTQRFAFKASAMLRNGEWVKVQKNPLDTTKRSKAGRLKLLMLDGKYQTLVDMEPGDEIGLLKTVFLNGEVVKTYTFDEIRENAKL